MEIFGYSVQAAHDPDGLTTSQWYFSAYPYWQWVFASITEDKKADDRQNAYHEEYTTAIDFWVLLVTSVILARDTGSIRKMAYKMYTKYIGLSSRSSSDPKGMCLRVIHPGVLCTRSAVLYMVWMLPVLHNVSPWSSSWVERHLLEDL